MSEEAGSGVYFIISNCIGLLEAPLCLVVGKGLSTWTLITQSDNLLYFGAAKSWRRYL